MEDGRRIEEILNLCEAAPWFAIAAIIAWKQRGRADLPHIYRRLPPAFFVFGVSDLIESQTAAFGDPWWLLVMKVACVAVFLIVFQPARPRHRADACQPPNRRRASGTG